MVLGVVDGAVPVLVTVLVLDTAEGEDVGMGVLDEGEVDVPVEVSVFETAFVGQK